MPNSPEFLIDSILPSKEVHLLAGSSGSGKTTWLFQMLADWQSARPILGHNSCPVPYLYISIDRSRASVTRTLERLGLKDHITRVLCTEETGDINGFADVMRVGRTAYPDTRLFIIEGFLTMAGEKGNSYFPVYRLLSSATRHCVETDISIIGICHTPKMKKGEDFKHGRENIMGSAAWGGFGDTVFHLDQDEATGIITMMVMPRNAPTETFKFRFGPNGVLTPVEFSGVGKAELELYLYALPVGTIVTRQEIYQQAAEYNISDSTAKRVIADSIEDGLLEQVGRGAFRRRPDPTIN